MESFTQELKILRSLFVRVAALFGISAAAFFVPIHGVPVAAWVIEQMKNDLVPASVSLIALSPTDSFFAECELALALALVITAPYLLWELWRYMRPGLYAIERKAGGSLLVAAGVLLVVGVTFAYMLLIPLTYKGLYGFAPQEVSTFFTIRQLVGQSVGLMLATGLFFLLPIIMIGLSKLGLVGAQFWSTHWRHAVLLVVVVSAIITPDGSGASMALLSIPLCVLYAMGVVGREHSRAVRLFINQKHMFDLGIPEIAVIVLVIGVLFFGSRKILELSRSMGRMSGEFKKGKMDIERELREGAKEGEENTNA